MCAHRCLPEKNRLTAADARQVEEIFQAKLATPSATGDADQPHKPATRPAEPLSRDAGNSKYRSRSKEIDKSALTWPEPRRIRDRNHVKAVAQHPCLICGRRPSDAHDLRFAQSLALGRKVSDEFTVPLCRGHHREVHRCSDEAAWWRSAGVDPTGTARALWLETHPLSVTPETRVCGTQEQTAGLKPWRLKWRKLSIEVGTFLGHNCAQCIVDFGSRCRIGAGRRRC